MDLVGRLKKYMEHVKLPISQFADVALIPRPTLSQILSGRNKKISNELLEKLHTAFPRLNISWLLFGDGEMEINSIPQIQAQNNPTPKAETPKQTQLFESAPSSEQGDIDVDFIDFTLSMNSPTEDIKPSKQQEQKEVTSFSPDTQSQSAINAQVSLNPDANKKIQTIMVFYSDNSFEIFRPSQR